MTTLTGTAGADTLAGGAGNNHMVGGSGADVLVAGGGVNEMIGDNTASVQATVGGAGNDAFVISLQSLQAGAAANPGLTTPLDTIYDFGGAGGWSATNNDFIAFTGFSAGSSVTSIVNSTQVTGLAYYTVHDAASNQSFVVAIESTDGNHLAASTGDFNFYS